MYVLKTLNIFCHVHRLVGVLEHIWIHPGILRSILTYILLLCIEAQVKFERSPSFTPSRDLITLCGGERERSMILETLGRFRRTSSHVVELWEESQEDRPERAESEEDARLQSDCRDIPECESRGIGRGICVSEETGDSDMIIEGTVAGTCILKAWTANLESVHSALEAA